MNYPDYLVHFNPYHNPKNGQFAPAKGGRVYGRLDKMSDKDLHKTLKKEVKATKKEKWGWSNQWMSQIPIGPNSETLLYENEQKEKTYKNTPEYKAWLKKVKALENKGENNEISVEEYDSQWEKLMKEAPERDFDTLHFTGVWTKNGIEYMDDFVNKGGRNLSVAYLEDMGYSTEKAKEYVDRMARSGLTLGA